MLTTTSTPRTILFSSAGHLMRACTGNTASKPARRSIHACAARMGPWDGPLKKQMYRYVVIAEDYPNPGALARRLEVRDQHMSDVRKGVEVGRVELAGGLLSRDFSELEEDSSPVHSLCGSAFVVQGESLEEVRSRVLSDEYTRASAWDPTSLKIYPFLPAFMNPLPTKPPTMKEQLDVISRRTPRGVSQSRAKSIKRNEVFVNDPRSTGAALNNQDRASIGRSLSELRRDHLTGGGQSVSQRNATLDSLRKTAPKAAQ